MKKILFGIIALIILVGGAGFAWYKVSYGGGTYYVQITKDGKEKEVVTFYITDDKNHLPVRLDMYLRFGSAKAFLTEAKGVRNPQTAIIK